MDDSGTSSSEPHIRLGVDEWNRLVNLAWRSGDPALVQAVDQAVASAVSVRVVPIVPRDHASGIRR